MTAHNSRYRYGSNKVLSDRTYLEPDSRYNDQQILLLGHGSNHSQAYLSRRFLPRGEQLPLVDHVQVRESERLDQLANRTLGDPTQYWRICDANNAMFPPDLVRVPGRELGVPLPQADQPPTIDADEETT
jgi:hypothetical protein